jgi:hypothetical protein
MFIFFKNEPSLLRFIYFWNQNLGRKTKTLEGQGLHEFIKMMVIGFQVQIQSCNKVCNKTGLRLRYIFMYSNQGHG